MAGEIRLTPEQLESRAKQFKAQAESLDKSRKTMQKLIDALATEWTGEASKKYQDRFNTIKPSFENAYKLMLELEHNLNQTASIMRDTDKKIASKLM